jgi:hypothetical protein
MLYKLEIEIHELSEIWEVEIDVEIKEREIDGETWHEVSGYKVTPNQKLPNVILVHKRIENAFQKEVRNQNIINHYYDNLF